MSHPTPADSGGGIRIERYWHETLDGTLYIYDVNKALLLTWNHPIYQLNLASAGITLEVVREKHVGLNIAHAASVNLNQPVMVIPHPLERMKDGRPVVLVMDGWHRIYKALRLGVPDVRVRALSWEEAESCILEKHTPGHGIPWREEAQSHEPNRVADPEADGQTDPPAS